MAGFGAGAGAGGDSRSTYVSEGRRQGRAARVPLGRGGARLGHGAFGWGVGQRGMRGVAAGTGAGAGGGRGAWRQARDDGVWTSASLGGKRLDHYHHGHGTGPYGPGVVRQRHTAAYEILLCLELLGSLGLPFPRRSLMHGMPPPPRGPPPPLCRQAPTTAAEHHEQVRALAGLLPCLNACLACLTRRRLWARGGGAWRARRVRT